MKIGIKTEKRYTLVIGGEDSPGWKEESSWEGLTKYVRGTESVIVSQDQRIPMIDGIFRRDDEPVEASVVMASPSIAEKLMRGED